MIDDQFNDYLGSRNADRIVGELRDAYLAGAHDTVRRILSGADPEDVYAEVCETMHEWQGALH